MKKLPLSLYLSEEYLQYIEKMCEKMGIHPSGFIAFLIEKDIQENGGK